MSSGLVYADFIRRVRLSRGLSQGQLARTTGISQPNLSAYENGRRTPNADALNRIVVACGYQLAALGGPSAICCKLPRAGWFPDDDLCDYDAAPAVGGNRGTLIGQRDPTDPPDEPPPVTPQTSPEERSRRLMDVLALAEATRAHR